MKLAFGFWEGFTSKGEAQTFLLVVHLSFTYRSPIAHLASHPTSLTYRSPVVHLSFTYRSPRVAPHVAHLSLTYQCATA